MLCSIRHYMFQWHLTTNSIHRTGWNTDKLSFQTSFWISFQIFVKTILEIFKTIVPAAQIFKLQMYFLFYDYYEINLQMRWCTQSISLISILHIKILKLFDGSSDLRLKFNVSKRHAQVLNNKRLRNMTNIQTDSRLHRGCLFWSSFKVFQSLFKF